MKIKNFDSFNEEFIGIDLKKIKQSAFDFHKTNDCRKVLSTVDLNLLDNTIKELKSLKQKWGSIDHLSKRLLNKAENKNEGIIGTVILSTFGIHAIWKMLVALKNNYTFMGYLGRLFRSGTNAADVKTFRDIVISVLFCVYLIGFITQSNTDSHSCYQTTTGALVSLTYRWDGIHDYKVSDSYNKQYNFKRTGYGEFDILYKGKKIGITDGKNLFSLGGDEVSTGFGTDKYHTYTFTNVDLEKLLMHKVNVKAVSGIEMRKKEIDKMNKEIDSLNVKTYENVDIARKVLKEHNLDYDKVISVGQDDDQIRYQKPNGEFVTRTNNPKVNTFLEIKNLLTQNNNLGYLGLFAKLIFNDTRRGMYQHNFLLDIYNNIKQNKDIINNLRDNNGNLKNIMDFDKSEDLIDSLNRLGDWKIVNLFVRELPPTQKRLIWKDGWFRDELKTQSQFITNSIKKISGKDELFRYFLKKVSSIKTQKEFIETLSRLTNSQPWDFNYWLDKLNKTRNVYVTWSSPSENQIICVVVSHRAIKKIAYMTSWCIVRDSSYFNSYSAKGLQCVLYDFNCSESENNSITGFTVNNLNGITDCHNKSDGRGYVPPKFKEDIVHPGERYSRDSIKKEYLKINLAKAALKFDSTFLKVFRNSISRTLNRPIISDFIDFYDED